MSGGERPFKAATLRVRAALEELGLPCEIARVDESARTAAGAAAAVGAEVGQIVKSLVFLSDGEPVLAFVSGSNRLDAGRLAALTGGRIERADADAVREATGYAIGGVPPVGHATRMRVFCDRDLLLYDTVWAAAGTPDTVFPIAPQALVAATGAEVAELAET